MPAAAATRITATTADPDALAAIRIVDDCAASAASDSATVGLAGDCGP